MYGLDGLKHHKVEKSLDITIVTTESEERARILRGRISNVYQSAFVEVAFRAC